MPLRPLAQEMQASQMPPLVNTCNWQSTSHEQYGAHDVERNYSRTMSITVTMPVEAFKIAYTALTKGSPQIGHLCKFWRRGTASNHQWTLSDSTCNH